MSIVRPDEIPQNVYIPEALLRKTINFLRSKGLYGQEGVCLWLGYFLKPYYKGIKEEVLESIVLDVLIGETDSSSVHSTISDAIISRFLDRISDLKKLDIHLFTVALVHSHPHEAFHSPTDTRALRKLGSGVISIVVPDFGNIELDDFIKKAKIFELDETGEDVREWDEREKKRRIKIIPETSSREANFSESTTSSLMGNMSATILSDISLKLKYLNQDIVTIRRAVEEFNQLNMNSRTTIQQLTRLRDILDRLSYQLQNISYYTTKESHKRILSQISQIAKEIKEVAEKTEKAMVNSFKKNNEIFRSNNLQRLFESLINIERTTADIQTRLAYVASPRRPSQQVFDRSYPSHLSVRRYNESRIRSSYPRQSFSTTVAQRRSAVASTFRALFTWDITKSDIDELPLDDELKEFLYDKVVIATDRIILVSGERRSSTVSIPLDKLERILFIFAPFEKKKSRVPSPLRKKKYIVIVELNQRGQRQKKKFMLYLDEDDLKTVYKILNKLSSEKGFSLENKRCEYTVDKEETPQSLESNMQTDQEKGEFRSNTISEENEETKNTTALNKQQDTKLNAGDNDSRDENMNSD